MKILIVGIGGVGGYFGGLLADRYYVNSEIEVYFLARGEHLRSIQANGLTLLIRGEQRVVFPKLATEDPNALGIMDIILFCTKGYDLGEAALSLASCVSKETIITPLLNGVDASGRIREVLPEADVVDGCVYIIARLKEPGVMENAGNIQKLYFGKQGITDDRLMGFEKICREAGIEATCSDQVQEVIWEKFIFISPLATATSFYNMHIGKLREEHPGELYQLIYEVHALSFAKGIVLPEDIIEKTVKKINAIPYENTTSMHADRLKGKNSEVESLTGYVMREGKKHGVNVKLYEEMFAELMKS